MWDIIGHNKQIRYLEKDIAQNSVKHAYLFTGPEKVGKFTVIRHFAQILQCPDKGCGSCSICRQVELGHHPDTILLRDNSESLKVEEIREVIERTNRTFQSPYFIVCIETVERMTSGTANALLKTLEEPAPHVVFLMSTNNENLLLPTFLSRVFTLELGGIERKDLTAYLEKKFSEAGGAEIEEAINLSLDKPGLAIEMLKDKEILNYHKNLYNRLKRMIEQDSKSSKLEFVDEILAEYKNDPAGLKQALKDFFELLTYMLRSVLVRAGQHKEQHFLLEKGPEDVMLLLEKIQETQKLIAMNVNKKLALESLMLYF